LIVVARMRTAWRIVPIGGASYWDEHPATGLTRLVDDPYYRA
jgi:hypothetical protein